MDPDYRFGLCLSAASCNEFSKRKKRKEEGPREGWTASSSGGQWWGGRREIVAFRQPEYIQTSLVWPDLCSMPLCSVWMRLPGEHRNKKKCREVGGRMDTAREQRGGEVDKKKKGQEWSLSEGWEEKEEDHYFKWSPQISKNPKPHTLGRKATWLALVVVNSESNKNRQSKWNRAVYMSSTWLPCKWSRGELWKGSFVFS